MSFLAGFGRRIEVADQRLRNMGQLMRRIGLDLESFSWRREGRDMTEAVRVCRICPSVERCTQWLRESSGGADGVPNFCSNRRRFSKAKADAHLRRP